MEVEVDTVSGDRSSVNEDKELSNMLKEEKQHHSTSTTRNDGAAAGYSPASNDKGNFHHQRLMSATLF